MATDTASQGPRRGSVRVDPKLASEEDAAVLAKMGFVQFTLEKPGLRLIG